MGAFRSIGTYSLGFSTPLELCSFLERQGGRQYQEEREERPEGKGGEAENGYTGSAEGGDTYWTEPAPSWKLHDCGREEKERRGFLEELDAIVQLYVSGLSVIDWSPLLTLLIFMRRRTNDKERVEEILYLCPMLAQLWLLVTKLLPSYFSPLIDHNVSFQTNFASMRLIK